MREACKKCRSTDGTIEQRNGQACVFCADCGSWCYNAPRTETGAPRRSTQSQPGISPKTKARVLAAHGDRCFRCGRSSGVDGVVLHIDHIVARAAAERAGLYDHHIESDANLVPFCDECNLGKSDDMDAVSIALLYRALVLKNQKGSAA